MGNELACRATYARRSGDGRALLETDALLFRGDFRVSVPLASVSRVAARDGWLSLTSPAGTLRLELGDRADAWAEKIRNPPSVVDKLGVKPGMTVSVLGVSDEPFLAGVRARAARTTIGRVAPGSDIVVVAIAREADLKRLPWLKRVIAPDGAIWTIRPKGKDGVPESAVMAAGKAAGLVDVKVARFSATHTAEKFVVPRAKRR